MMILELHIKFSVNSTSSGDGNEVVKSNFTSEEMTVSFNSKYLVDIASEVEDKNLKIGQDISILTFDDDLSYFREDGEIPLFTSTKSSVREAGYKTANLLIESIKNPTQETQGILLEAELTIGLSTKRFRPIS